MIKSFLSLLTFLTLSMAAVESVGAELITDDLVTNLSCENLTKESFLQSIDVQKAFSVPRHLPVRNWSFSVGLYEIANCWSLSHSQRILFYLGREQAEQTPEALKQTLNMLRKYTPQGTYNTFHIVPWNPAWYESMVTGWSSSRNFKKDIETYQDKRFHNVDNTTYLQGSRERGIKENAKSILVLKANVDAKKLTNILIRPALRSQHIVLAKYSITRPTGEIDFFVYDSNRPQKDVVVTYNPKTQHFYAPEIVEYFKIARPEDPIGLFIVDEGDRNLILDTAYQYYSENCEALHWATN